MRYIGLFIGICLLFSNLFVIAQSTDADPSLDDHYEALGDFHIVKEIGLHLHDPSRIVEIDGYRMIAVTGKEQSDGYACGLEIWYLPPDETEWIPGQCLLTDKPQWVGEELPTNDGAYWAPDFLSPRVLYYSVSAGFNAENQGGAIGRLDAIGSPPHLTWVDSGQVITASFNAEANDDPEPQAIDPALFTDVDGKQYLVYGGGHIWLTELDTETGAQIEGNWWTIDDPTYVHLANGATIDEDGVELENDERAWIEAPYIHYDEGYYYLFVNWFSCCRGIDSTYEIRVGRSTSVTGPYHDRDGVDMRDNGGTLLLDRAGDILDDPRYIGPGHPAIYQPNDETTCMTFHYYDGVNNGVSQLGVVELAFDDDWVRAIQVGCDF